MVHVLDSLKANFILSINDLPGMRMVFKGFKINPVTLKYSANKEGWTEGKELLVSNF